VFATSIPHISLMLPNKDKFITTTSKLNYFSFNGVFPWQKPLQMLWKITINFLHHLICGQKKA